MDHPAGKIMATSDEIDNNRMNRSRSLIITTRPNGHHKKKNQEANHVNPNEIHEQMSLQESEIRYRRLFEAAQDGILILDADTGMITDVNPYLINMLGYSREEMVTKRLWEVGAFKDIEASVDAFRSLQKKEYIRYENLPLRSKGGLLIQVEFVSNVYLVGLEKVIQCNIRNITEQRIAQDALRKSENALRELSWRDHLTGLYNRRFLEENLRREMLRAKRKNTLLGVIMLDIDNFKHYNDHFGHAAGDFVLREVGNLLLGNIRGEDILSRYGGDEFVIILPEISLEAVSERAEHLRDQAQHHQYKFKQKNIEGITLSIGVAIFPANGNNLETILQSADRALYQAKQNGRNKVELMDS
jgi:diguanylate cyclase (GGDEF)-like protein/PAS domain S-box-containing protein